MTSIPKSLEAILAADWKADADLAPLRVIATERSLDRIGGPTAQLRQTGIGRCPEAPLSHRNVRVLLTIISPHEDMDKAGTQLEGFVTAALDYLDTRFQHEDATQVAYNDRLAYDIPLIITASKE